MKSILLLGGTRFFGKILAQKIVDSGKYQLTILSRGLAGDNPPVSCEWIRCDRSDELAVRSAVKGRFWDYVFDQSCYVEEQARIAATHILDRCGHYIFLAESLPHLR